MEHELDKHLGKTVSVFYEHSGQHAFSLQIKGKLLKTMLNGNFVVSTEAGYLRFAPTRVCKIAEFDDTGDVYVKLYDPIEIEYEVTG